MRLRDERVILCEYRASKIGFTIWFYYWNRLTRFFRLGFGVISVGRKVNGAPARVQKGEKGIFT